METISVYKAIQEMRRITKNRGTFSFSAMSYERDKQSSHGIVECSRAKLRKAPRNSKGTINDIMLHYTDDNGLPKKIYQPALMTFNGLPCELK